MPPKRTDRSGPRKGAESRRAKPGRPAPARAGRPGKAAPLQRAERPARPVAQRAEPAAAVEKPRPPPLPIGVQTLTVTEDEEGMRLDRFLKHRFPALGFTAAQKILRTGQVRVDGGRVKGETRLAAGQAVRIPPLRHDGDDPEAPAVRRSSGDDGDFLRSITLFENRDVLVLNKPFGLAVQGGSGTTRHVDGMLDALRGEDGQRPRLVHRLDKDTSGCLVIAKTRLAAAELAKTFRSRSARKIYWAVVAGVPRLRQGRISSYLAKEGGETGERMRIAEHGERHASHALTYYAVVDQAGPTAAWLSLKPVTGRTHQLRAHCEHIGHPIIGDPKYFRKENRELPGGIQNRLHLLARRIVLPLPRGGGTLDVTAPLPAHMVQSFNLLGFDASEYDPIVDAPEE
jgi:23S rRNA pseudouridine955/2504/2580 synthase